MKSLNDILKEIDTEVERQLVIVRKESKKIGFFEGR